MKDGGEGLELEQLGRGPGVWALIGDGDIDADVAPQGCRRHAPRCRARANWQKERPLGMMMDGLNQTEIQQSESSNMLDDHRQLSRL
jgi:hypothetical protein